MSLLQIPDSFCSLTISEPHHIFKIVTVSVRNILAAPEYLEIERPTTWGGEKKRLTGNCTEQNYADKYKAAQMFFKHLFRNKDISKHINSTCKMLWVLRYQVHISTVSSFLGTIHYAER